MTDEQAIFLARGIVAMSSDRAKIATISCKVEPVKVGSAFAFKASWINSSSGKWQSLTFFVDDIKTADMGKLINLVADAFQYMKSNTGSDVFTKTTTGFEVAAS